MTTTVTAHITPRKGTAAQWTSANPILWSGEEGYETDTGKQKVGDGVTAWTSLAYYYDPNALTSAIDAHELESNPHPVYLTAAEGDATYSLLAHTHSEIYEPANVNLQSHVSSTSNPHSTTAAQVGADATGTAAGLIATHESAVNPHPVYLTTAEGDAAYEAIGAVSGHAVGSGVHSIAGVTGLQTALDGKSATSHDHSGTYEAAGTVSTHAAGSNVHAIASVTGLQTALDGKSSTSHNHSGTYEVVGAVSTHAALTTTHGISAFGATLVDDADAATARTTLGLGTAATTASTDYATAAHNHATVVASDTHAATSKTTPVDADELPLVDSAASWVLKKLTWANLVAKIKTAISYFKDSTNVFVGYNSLPAITTGTYNSCIGYNAGDSITDGVNNNCQGFNAGTNINTGGYNNCIGAYAGNGITTGSYNNCIGYTSGFSITTGSFNVAIGRDAGRYHADGTTALTDPESCVYIGANARGKDNADANSVVIGGTAAIGLGANTTVIGTSVTTLTRLFGNLGLGVDSPSASIHTVKTTEQLRLGYDATYYTSFTVSSAGNLTITPVGGTINIGNIDATSVLIQSQILSAVRFGAL